MLVARKNAHFAPFRGSNLMMTFFKLPWIFQHGFIRAFRTRKTKLPRINKIAPNLARGGAETIPKDPS